MKRELSSRGCEKYEKEDTLKVHARNRYSNFQTSPRTCVCVCVDLACVLPKPYWLVWNISLVSQGNPVLSSGFQIFNLEQESEWHLSYEINELCLK